MTTSHATRGTAPSPSTGDLLADLDQMRDEARDQYPRRWSQEARNAVRDAEKVFLGTLAVALADHPEGPGMWARALEATRASELVR